MANEGQLAALRQGQKAFRELVGDRPREGVDLSGADLRGLPMEGLYLQGANLEGANLAGCSLRRTRLNSANLRCADLRGCDLADTGMHRADLRGADLRGARGARFGVADSRLCISPASFEGVRWDREALEYVLGLINLNPDWDVRYEIAPKGEPSA